MTTGQGSWSVDYYDFDDFPAPTGVGPEELGDIERRARDNGAFDGTPILLSTTWGADGRINLYFREGLSSRRPTTWKRYASALVVWLNFLDDLGRRWFEAQKADYRKFKHWRMTDTRNMSRVQGTTFETDRQALLSFYKWAGEEYGLANPISTRPESGPATTKATNRKGDPGKAGGAVRKYVKWLLRPAFEQWRDIGLRGYDFSGRRPDRWQGWNEDRDAAFVEGLWGTGLRLQEWGTILDVELPPRNSTARYPKAWLAQQCAKGGRYGRDYWIPQPVLQAMDGYMDPIEGSRREAIERAQRAGRYEGLRNMLIVSGHNPRSRTVYVRTEGGATPLSLNALTIKERLRVFRMTDTGLEPLAVWLGIDGMPMQHHSWENTFAAANERIAEAWVRATAPHLVGDRREQHKAECELWARPHMMRHSFALRWYSILMAVWEARTNGLSERQQRELKDQVDEVWFTLATLLGHRSPLTTKNWYLAQFTRLKVDYLMALMDRDDHAAVSTLLARLAADSGLVLTAITPEHAERAALSIPEGQR